MLTERAGWRYKRRRYRDGRSGPAAWARAVGAWHPAPGPAPGCVPTDAIAKSTRRHIAWLEKEYQAVLQDNATLADRAALYRTVPGIGPLTAATLVAHLPELGHWDSKALTSLVGLAPWSRDSGKQRGHRAIRGGRGLVRRALYMCAWAVIRHDSEMRRFYDRLRQRGKPGNVAVVAVMRKILLQLNAVARRGTPWVPQDA